MRVAQGNGILMIIVREVSMQNKLAKTILTIFMAFNALLLAGCGGRSDIGEPRVYNLASDEI